MAYIPIAEARGFTPLLGKKSKFMGKHQKEIVTEDVRCKPKAKNKGAASTETAPNYVDLFSLRSCSGFPQETDQR